MPNKCYHLKDSSNTRTTFKSQNEIKLVPRVTSGNRGQPLHPSLFRQFQSQLFSMFWKIQTTCTFPLLKWCRTFTMFCANTFSRPDQHSWGSLFTLISLQFLFSFSFIFLCLSLQVKLLRCTQFLTHCSGGFRISSNSANF